MRICRNPRLKINLKIRRYSCEYFYANWKNTIIDSNQQLDNFEFRRVKKTVFIFKIETNIILRRPYLHVT